MTSHGIRGETTSRDVGWNGRFKRGMPNRVPVDHRDPAFLLGGVSRNPIDEKFIRRAAVIGIFAIKRECETFAQLDLVLSQIVYRALAIQAEAAGRVRALEIVKHSGK